MKTLLIAGTGASNNEEVEMKAAGWRLPENLSPPFYQHDSIANPTVKSKSWLLVFIPQLISMIL